MRSIRTVIDAAKAGQPVTWVEAKALAMLLDVHWRQPCPRCRRSWPVDHLDERGGRCEECDEAVERVGE